MNVADSSGLTRTAYSQRSRVAWIEDFIKTFTKTYQMVVDECAEKIAMIKVGMMITKH